MRPSRVRGEGGVPAVVAAVVLVFVSMQGVGASATSQAGLTPIETSGAPQAPEGLDASTGGPAPAAGPEGAAPSADARGYYRGRVTNARSGKPVPGAALFFMPRAAGEERLLSCRSGDYAGVELYQASTDPNGEYEIRMPTGAYRAAIRVGKKCYKGSGSFREVEPGKSWILDFVIEGRFTESDFEIVTDPLATGIKLVEPPPPPPVRWWKEFLGFLGGLAAVAALSE